MAKAPNLVNITMESLTDLKEDQKPGFKNFISILNPFLVDTTKALSNNLTFGQNFLAVYKTVSILIPEETWTDVTPINGWAQYGSPYYNAGYMITNEGIVKLRGAVAGGTTTPGTAMFTLPEGYRPSKPILFPVVINNAFGRIDIATNGNVAFTTGTANTYVFFDGIQFYAGNSATPAAPPLSYSGAGWPIQLASGFANATVNDLRLVKVRDLSPGTNFSNGAYTPAWVVDSNGNVIINRIGGLSPGRKYELTFLILGQ